MLADLATRTSGVLAANFLTDTIDRQAVAAAAARVRLIDFFWASPDPSLVQIAHDNGALAQWQTGSLDEALAAVDAGCDSVVVQGVEAGGHIRGYSPLLPLLESVVARVEVPVLAAGGIGDERGFIAALAAGAAGVRVGTRFVATDESGAHPDYKRAIIVAGSGSTEITDAFAVCPLCATVPRARVLSSSVGAVHTLSDEIVGQTLLRGHRTPVPRGHGMPPSAVTEGHIEAMAQYAGEAVASIDHVLPASEVIRSWCDAAESASLA